MDIFADYLASIENPAQRERTQAVLTWIAQTFPALVPKVAWNQPTFTDHGTFIIALSTAAKHMAIAPETAALTHFSQDIRQSGYLHTPNIIRIAWTDDVDFSLLERIIAFNIKDKANCATFWRKASPIVR